MIDSANAARGTGHRVIGSSRKEPSINECFNWSSALISDISSVVSDFLASEKPYAVFNHTESPTEEFVTEFPSTGASTVIGRDGSGIEEFLAVVTRSTADIRAESRSRLATYLLGTPQQRTVDAFQSSVDDFINRSNRDRADYRALPQVAPDDLPESEDSQV